MLITSFRKTLLINKNIQSTFQIKYFTSDKKIPKYLFTCANFDAVILGIFWHIWRNFYGKIKSIVSILQQKLYKINVYYIDIQLLRFCDIFKIGKMLSHLQQFCCFANLTAIFVKTPIFFRIFHLKKLLSYYSPCLSRAV